MKKLLMITTGGTIASGTAHGGGLEPEKSGSELVPVLEDTEIHVLDLYAIDSTDVSPAHWRRLYEAVTDNLPLYDGIVILHGTDTMAYTGAALAFTVDTEKPVILTGSMLPFGEKGSDAPGNIQFASLIAKYGRYKGVNLVFANHVIGGADIAKVNSTAKSAFRRFAGFVPEKKLRFPEKDGEFPDLVKLSPFTTAEGIAKCTSPAGTVIETFGAGGLPEEITDAVSELAKRVPVVITTHCLGGTDLHRYEVGRRALRAGAADGGKMSTECAAVWLWLRYNQ